MQSMRKTFWGSRMDSGRSAASMMHWTRFVGIADESELDIGPRCPKFLRLGHTRMAYPVRGTPHRRFPHHPLDTQMAEGRGDGRRGGDESEAGTPQGARRRYWRIFTCTTYSISGRSGGVDTMPGEMIFVRYADDICAGFEYEADAKRFLADCAHGWKQFALSLHPDKTRLIEFGRFAAERRSNGGLASRRHSTSSDLRLSADATHKANSSS